MDRYRPNRRVQLEESEPPKYDDVEDEDRDGRDDDDDNSNRLRPSENNVTEDQEPFMGIKVRRKASLHRDYKGDYLDVASHPYLMKILQKQALAAVEKMCLSELSDNFFAIIIPSEYDLLMASTRKTEIVTVLVEATKGASEELEVAFSNSFEYHAAAELVKEVVFEEVEGGIKTRILTKSESA
ncbi:TH1 domain-containing protein [Citrus sinensis]|nr:TH1 domain-containing protein [Citrus sinensis]